MGDPGTIDPRDDELVITAHHSSFYRWLPISEEDARALADSEVDMPDQLKTKLVEATFPGFKLRRTTVEEPTISTTNVHLPSLRSMNDDREAAGVARRPHHANLAQHLADGPWPRHFPLSSLTDIECDDPTWQDQLRGHFFEEVPE